MKVSIKLIDYLCFLFPDVDLTHVADVSVRVSVSHLIQVGYFDGKGK